MQRGTVLQLLGGGITIASVFLFTTDLHRAEVRVQALEAQLDDTTQMRMVQPEPPAVQEMKPGPDPVPPPPAAPDDGDLEEARARIEELFRYLEARDPSGAAGLFAENGDRINGLDVDRQRAVGLFEGLISKMTQRRLLGTPDQGGRQPARFERGDGFLTALILFRSPQLHGAIYHLELRYAKGMFSVFDLAGPGF